MDGRSSNTEQKETQALTPQEPASEEGKRVDISGCYSGGCALAILLIILGNIFAFAGARWLIYVGILIIVVIAAAILFLELVTGILDKLRRK